MELIIRFLMVQAKRQNFPVSMGGLWVVATPIGHLGDLSTRAREVFAQVDSILCEDTRKTAVLLHSLDIKKPLFRLDAYASQERIAKIVENLTSGQKMALVTDAGTPGISDPAAALIASVQETDIRISVVPGPSAVTALLSITGFPETAFAFHGFFPKKEGEREREMLMALNSPVAKVFVWFESPRRILETVDFLFRKIPQQHIVLAKELTKIHERCFSGLIKDVHLELQRSAEIPENLNGEWCFAVYFKTHVQQNKDEVFSEDVPWVKALQMLLDMGVRPSEAVKRVSQYFGIQKKTVYVTAVRLSGKKCFRGA